MKTDVVASALSGSGSSGGSTDWGALLDVCDAVNRDACGAILAETLAQLTPSLVSGRDIKSALLLSDTLAKNCSQRLRDCADAPSTSAWDAALLLLSRDGLVDDESMEQARAIVALRCVEFTDALQRDLNSTRRSVEAARAALTELDGAVEKVRADPDGDAGRVSPSVALLREIDLLLAAAPRLAELCAPWGDGSVAEDDEDGALRATCLALQTDCANVLTRFERVAVAAALLASGIAPED